MNGYVDWIGAAADEADPAKTLNASVPFAQGEARHAIPASPLQELVAHNFPARLHPPTEAQMQDDPLDRNPDLWMYRKRTLALVRRFWRFSLETGRLPSAVGREFFRGKMTAYTATTFEDRVIFVRDVEKCMDRLEHWDQQLIARLIFQEYEQTQVARILHCGLRTVERRLPQVLDLLSEEFLRVGLLTAVPSRGRSSQ
jgi:hypothetical protein